MGKIFEKYHRWFFGAVALLLLYPTFRGGYIFTLDGPVAPFASLADINFGADGLATIIARLASILFGFALWQRIFLLGTIFFLGLAGFRLARRTGNAYAQYFAGLLFIFNPFIYARLVEQTGIATGCAAFFWFLAYLSEYLEDGQRTKIIWASACAGLAISFFLHSAFFVFSSLAVILILDYFRRRDIKFLGKVFLIVSAIVFVINANWILTAAFGVGETRANAVESFTQMDAKAFATRPIGGHSVYATVLALQGYWGEYQDRFVSIQDNPLWFLAFWLIFGLALFGLIKTWKTDNFSKPLLFLFLAAYILAIGVASPFIKPLALWLYAHVPFYLGLREPQKWVAVLVFVYAYLGAWGIKYLLEIEKVKNYKKEIGLFCALLPVIFSFSMIRGTHEHFMPHQFPEEWREARNYLDENPAGGKILFFPWHSYLKMSFTGINASNPARGYFGKEIISGNNTEFGGVYSHSLDPQTLAIEKYVAREDNPEKNIEYGNFSSDMQKIGIQTVMLAKAEDWQKYLWLDKIGAEKVLENSQLIIYKLHP